MYVMTITSRIFSICSLAILLSLSSLAPQLAKAVPVSGEISSDGTWKYPKLRMDSNEVLYSLYWYNPSDLALERELRILWWNGTSWQDYASISAADVNAQLAGRDFIAYGNEYRSSFAIDSQDRLHVVFPAGSSSISSSHDPVHGVYDGSWSYSLVSNESNSSNNISLFIDDNDNVHAAYTVDGIHEGKNHILKYATNQSGSWVASEILETDDRGNDELHDTHIVVDSSDNVTILFRRENGQSNHWDNYYQTNAADFTTFSTPNLILDGNTAGKEYRIEAGVIDSSDTIYYIYNNITDSTAHFCSGVSSLCSSTPLDGVNSANGLTYAASTLYLLTSSGNQYLWKTSVNHGNLWQNIGDSFSLPGVIQDRAAVQIDTARFMVVSEDSSDWRALFLGDMIDAIKKKSFPWFEFIPGLVSPNKINQPR